MRTQIQVIFRMLALLILVSACTKSRRAELADEQKASVFAISEFGEASENSQFGAEITTSQSDSAASKSLQAFASEGQAHLLASDVSVPERMKFMFNNLPLSNMQTRQFKLTFSVDKEFVTSYKVASDSKKLSILEKAIALTAKEVQLIAKAGKASTGQMQALTRQQSEAQAEKEDIKSGKKEGALLIPLFKYKIESYGTVVRSKNELKEDTSKLELKKTEWKDATHIQLSAQTDSRLVVGMGVEQSRQLKQVYSESKIDNQIMSAEELQRRLSIGMKFLSNDTKVFTRLDANVMRVYEITSRGALNESQVRLLKNNAGNQEILSCQDESVSAFLKSSDADCVIVLKADVPVAYKTARLAQTDDSGSSNQTIQLEDVQRSKSVGLVEIQENAAAKQVDISGALDPNSTIKLSDIKGEFFYRRTFESASNMFLGRTGTSGDMTIIRFELEDNRIVVRNQQSLITYTGQGPKDREELMSFPVKYIRMQTTDAKGAKLTIPQPEVTTKEKAEYASIDWTNNTIPDSNSPLAFYSGGACFAATSSLQVTDTDMRLATNGVLNYSLSGSYTVKAEDGCMATKDVNSAYWGGTYQFNFNVKERISFMKNSNPLSDVQFAQNISGMAQSAFNFGVFTLADRVTEGGALSNRDGSEKYMPLIHDFRDNRKIKYHVGGLNNPAVTDPERREIMVEATKQVIDEWNRTLRLSFKGTPLERETDYVEVEFDNSDNDGHLGDLDRNYIWYQELTAENGLLGVAQPAANPRSGTIQSANVIIYSGNTMDQTVAQLKMTKLARDYELGIEKVKKEVLAQAAATQAPADSEPPSTDGPAVSVPTADRIKAQVGQINNTLHRTILAMQLESDRVQRALKKIKKNPRAVAMHKVLSADLFKNNSKGQIINYPVNEQTFLKKLAETAVNKKASLYPNEFELEVNKAFLQFGGLDESVKNVLKKRSQLLAAAIRFDENTKNRPGCFRYARNDINDRNLFLAADPQANLMLNYKKNIMSTLSHELGHAFGLLHNFKGSIDKSNYEFKFEMEARESKDKLASELGKKLGIPTKPALQRNYSSIMDYLADVDMQYAGPGPYDAYAIRAAYTGLVELSPAAIKSPKLQENIKISPEGLASIADVTKVFAAGNLVNLNKGSLNSIGVLKYYEQCDDSGLSESALCRQFDSGGSATEIVQNLIADYNRGYNSRNYVWDKILFGWPQKVAIINRNITLFQQIRSYLDEATNSYFYGTGLTKAANQAAVDDQVNAAKLGYVFFHELIRTPDSKDSVSKFGNRLMAVPYKYKNDKNEDVSDIRILEKRSVYDLNQTRDKIDSIGIGYDKMFAMTFLLQSTAAQTTDDSRNSHVSYLDFEQIFMGISDPADSPTMNTILEVLSSNLKSGFFAPLSGTSSLQFTELEVPVQATRLLSNQTALGTVVSLAESKWRGYDPFAEMFKVGRSSQAAAPSDRLNVAKAGQDRRLDDTKVMYATQNAFGASSLIDTAARNEFMINNRKLIFISLNDMLLADTEVAKADSAAKALVDKLRSLNGSGLVLDRELDAPDSKVNIENQVNMIRNLLPAELQTILDIKKMLEDSKPENLRAAIDEAKAKFAKTIALNTQVQELPLMSMGLSFVAEMAANIDVKLQDGEEFKGDVIAGMIMDPTKVKDDLDRQLDVIDKLSGYSALVDPDSVGK